MTRPVKSPLLIATVMLMDLLAGMEFDLFVPSFPELQQYFKLSPFWVEALLSVNFLGYCISLFFVGLLSDIYGRKPVIMWGLSIFVSGSLLCWLGYSYETMLLGRFLQGIGIAAPAILSFLIIADIYPLERQQSLFAIMNGIMNFSVGAAPVLGSYIALYFGWQGSFLTLLLLGGFSLFSAFVLVPNSKPAERVAQPFMKEYFSLFKSLPLTLLIMHFVLQLVPYWIFVGMSPLLYMKELGVSLTHFGFYQGVIATVFGFGSILFGLILHKINQRKALAFALNIFFISLVTVLWASFTDSPTALMITLAFIPFTIAEIIPSAILFPKTLNYNPEAKGRVSAIIQGGRLVFSALSLQIAGYFYQGTFLNIGLLISLFILMAMVTFWMVLHNKELMKAD